MIPADGANFTVWGSHRTHCKCCNVCVKNYRICKIILQLYLSAWCQITPLTKTRTESENSIWPILGIPDLVLVHFGNSRFGPDGWSHHRLLCFITNTKRNTAGLSASTTLLLLEISSHCPNWRTKHILHIHNLRFFGEQIYTLLLLRLFPQNILDWKSETANFFSF